MEASDILAVLLCLVRPSQTQASKLLRAWSNYRNDCVRSGIYGANFLKLEGGFLGVERCQLRGGADIPVSHQLLFPAVICSISGGKVGKAMEG